LVVLVVVDEVVDGDGFVAVGAGASGADFSAPGVAVVAALLAEVAGFAGWAFVDGGVFGGKDGAGCGLSSAPGGLSAGVGTPLPAAGRGERGAAHATRYRYGIVTHGVRISA
jgi:hypothetical protein